MSEPISLITIFTIISLAISFFNLTILVYLFTKTSKSATQQILNLNSKEFELLQRQYLFLQTRTDIEARRVEAIEKIISAMVVSSYPGNDDGGMMH